MIVIGLTGGSGSGKGAVTRVLAKAGIVSLDTDAVYHYLTDHDGPCVRELTAVFGSGICNPDGSLCRRKLSALVFRPDEGREERMRHLGEITHPYVRQECLIWLKNQEKSQAEMAVLDVPLLFQSGFDALCDITVAVLASEDKRLQRILLRDGITEAEARNRIAAQPSESYYRERADYCLQNDGDFAALTTATEELLHEIRHSYAGRKDIYDGDGKGKQI